MALWVSTGNVNKAVARLRAELEGETHPDWRPDQRSVEDARAVLDEVERLRGQVESWRKRAERRTDKIVKLQDELAELRKCGDVMPGPPPDNHCTKSAPHDWHQGADGVIWRS